MNTSARPLQCAQTAALRLDASSGCLTHTVRELCPQKLSRGDTDIPLQPRGSKLLKQKLQ